MHRSSSLVFTSLAVGLILILVSGNAYGYLDPGSGLYVLQILIAGALGALYAIKVYWQKIKAFLFARFAKPKDDSTHDEH